jgi:hypothetical protein
MGERDRTIFSIFRMFSLPNSSLYCQLLPELRTCDTLFKTEEYNLEINAEDWYPIQKYPGPGTGFDGSSFFYGAG